MTVHKNQIIYFLSSIFSTPSFSNTFVYYLRVLLKISYSVWLKCIYSYLWIIVIIIFCHHAPSRPTLLFVFTHRRLTISLYILLCVAQHDFNNITHNFVLPPAQYICVCLVQSSISFKCKSRVGRIQRKVDEERQFMIISFYLPFLFSFLFRFFILNSSFVLQNFFFFFSHFRSKLERNRFVPLLTNQ